MITTHSHFKLSGKRDPYPCRWNATTRAAPELCLKTFPLRAVLLIRSVQAISIAIALPHFRYANLVRLALELRRRAHFSGAALLVVARGTINDSVAAINKTHCRMMTNFSQKHSRGRGGRRKKVSTYTRLFGTQKALLLSVFTH
jgi:hypothetical protein